MTIVQIKTKRNQQLIQDKKNGMKLKELKKKYGIGITMIELIFRRGY